MPKYSTGSGGGGGDGDSCELCGRSTSSLRRANVAGAELQVCGECAPHDDARKGGSGSSGSGSTSDGADARGTSRQKRAAQQQAKVYDQATGDSTRWETEGTDYEKDRLPHLVSAYSDRVADARQDAGLTVEELAAELDVEKSALHAVEEGRAARADVGGSIIEALEERFGIELADE